MSKKVFILSMLMSSLAVSNQSLAEDIESTVETQTEWSILTEFNLYTDHSDSGYIDKEKNHQVYNESNELYSFGIKRNSVTYGYAFFDNSYYEDSHMVSVDFDFGKVWDVQFQLGVGLANGYDKDILRDAIYVGDILVAPLVSLKYEPDFLNFKGVQFAPKIRAMGFHTYMLNLELSYKL